MRVYWLVLTAVALLGCDDVGDGGRPPDAGALAADAASGGADAAPDAEPGEADANPFAGLSCDSEFCEPGTGCCTDTGGLRMCSNDLGSCSGDFAACDGPEDCMPTQVCCGAGGANFATSCTAEASCTAGVPRCHSGGDCSSGVCCPQGFCGPACD